MILSRFFQIETATVELMRTRLVLWISIASADPDQAKSIPEQTSHLRCKRVQCRRGAVQTHIRRLPRPGPFL